MQRKRFTAAAKRHYSLRANPVIAEVAAVAPVARPAPRGRRGRPRRQVAGVKNIEGRVHKKLFKITRLLPKPRNVEVKKRGVVVCRMVVRKETVFPAEVRRAYH